MTKTTARLVGSYELDVIPFGRSYKWHPAYVNLECDCGAESTLSGASNAAPVCSRCSAEHSGVIEEIQKREDRLGHEAAHPSGATTSKSKRNNA